jgi:hypothetical protein
MGDDKDGQMVPLGKEELSNNKLTIIELIK